MLTTDGLVEQHIHGAFGHDFMTCSIEELLETSERLLIECAVTAFFPTIMTNDTDIIKERIEIIKRVQKIQSNKSAKIAGIHLEGPFINPEKCGIHNKEQILPLDIDLFKKIEDSIIKIITLAPELDTNKNFIQYIKSKNIKISVGHSISSDLSNADQVTHLYNAMGSFTHRGKSTVVSALTEDNIYTEIIADSMHVSDEVLKITFRQKPIEKILLVSDALPLSHSNKKEQKFASQVIYNNNGKLTNKEGTLAGCSLLLCDIIKNLTDKNIISFEKAIITASENQLKYHKLENNLKVYWNNNKTINKIEII